eukprot:6925919-Pyramimonas_sp.AAC.1
MTLSGAFSILHALWSGQNRSATPVRLATWSANALMHHKPSLRTRKQKFLDSLLQPGAIVAIQEVH